ncbi:hypothetical protein P7K49_032007 [Saguinus oedipus]|uniref:Uncharacterized protein n=1 Tax=Saguinus oedipus TaxID=9490 RepID=A0ABQ9TX11_SAGOE|nr:hypothetical protein P7K49_032007 [Saguinus oedipus]
MTSVVEQRRPGTGPVSLSPAPATSFAAVHTQRGLQGADKRNRAIVGLTSVLIPNAASRGQTSETEPLWVSRLCSYSTRPPGGRQAKPSHCGTHVCAHTQRGLQGADKRNRATVGLTSVLIPNVASRGQTSETEPLWDSRLCSYPTWPPGGRQAKPSHCGTHVCAHTQRGLQGADKRNRATVGLTSVLLEGERKCGDMTGKRTATAASETRESRFSSDVGWSVH